MARKITLSPRRPVNASRRGFVVLLGAVPLAGLLPGCGGSGDGRLRVVNASIAYPSVDIEINDDVERTGVEAQSVDGYFNVEIDEDSHTLGMRSGSTTLAETSLGIDIDERWSAIFFGAESSFGLIAYQEDENEPDDDEFRLRAFNASATETIDVYVTATDALLSAVAPAVSGAAQETLTAFDDIASGTWRLRLTTGGNRTEVRLDTSVTLGGERVGTLVIYPSTSGLLVNAVLLVEERDAINLVNPKARLRFVNALASSSSITPTLDGTASGSTLPARTAASYVEADTGERTVGALINGSSFTTAVTLVGATDATCAIYGADSAPKVIVIADDNRAPTVSGQARIRLVNLVDGGGSLSLSIDLGSAVLTTAPGETSDHLQFTAIDDAQVDVLDGSGLSVATLTAVDLLADAVYTVFAMTDGSTVSAVLRRDR